MCPFPENESTGILQGKAEPSVLSVENSGSVRASAPGSELLPGTRLWDGQPGTQDDQDTGFVLREPQGES